MGGQAQTPTPTTARSLREQNGLENSARACFRESWLIFRRAPPGALAPETLALRPRLPPPVRAQNPTPTRIREKNGGETCASAEWEHVCTATCRRWIFRGSTSSVPALGVSDTLVRLVFRVLERERAPDDDPPFDDAFY